jgi:hypothetical protein
MTARRGMAWHGIERMPSALTLSALSWLLTLELQARWPKNEPMFPPYCLRAAVKQLSNIV